MFATEAPTATNFPPLNAMPKVCAPLPNVFPKFVLHALPLVVPKIKLLPPLAKNIEPLEATANKLVFEMAAALETTPVCQLAAVRKLFVGAKLPATVAILSPTATKLDAPP